MERIRLGSFVVAVLAAVLSGCGPEISEEAAPGEALVESSAALGACPSNYTCGEWTAWQNAGTPYCSATTPACSLTCSGFPYPTCTFLPGPGMSQNQRRTRFCVPPWTPPSPICTDVETRVIKVSCGAC